MFQSQYEKECKRLTVHFEDTSQMIKHTSPHAIEIQQGNEVIEGFGLTHFFVIISLTFLYKRKPQCGSKLR